MRTTPRTARSTPSPPQSQPVAGDLWMIAPDAPAPVRCQCDEFSEGGAHLIAPLGYGIAPGQRFELSSHPSRHAAIPGFDFCRSRWARVVDTHILLDDHGARLGVAVEYDS